MGRETYQVFSRIFRGNPVLRLYLRRWVCDKFVGSFNTPNGSWRGLSSPAYTGTRSLHLNTPDGSRGICSDPTYLLALVDRPLRIIVARIIPFHHGRGNSDCENKTSQPSLR